MNKTNPQIEQQLDALAQLCCDTLNGDNSGLADRSDALLKSLLMSGYNRKTGPNLSVELESRIKNSCAEVVMSRGAELVGVVRTLQQKFDQVAQWESKSPQNGPDEILVKDANFHPATDG